MALDTVLGMNHYHVSLNKIDKDRCTWEAHVWGIGKEGQML